MNLALTSPFEREPGVIVGLLKRSYEELVVSDRDTWEPEIENWEWMDRDVFEHRDTVGACTFLSWAGDDLVGFFCFDPRPQPAYGVIGHNCILPEFRRRGFGSLQILETLRRFRASGIRQAKVSTTDYPFFFPAQRMYTSCGFAEIKREPWERNPRHNMIYYDIALR